MFTYYHLQNKVKKIRNDEINARMAKAVKNISAFSLPIYIYIYMPLHTNILQAGVLIWWLRQSQNPSQIMVNKTAPIRPLDRLTPPSGPLAGRTQSIPFPDGLQVPAWSISHIRQPKPEKEVTEDVLNVDEKNDHGGPFGSHRCRPKAEGFGAINHQLQSVCFSESKRVDRQRGSAWPRWLTWPSIARHQKGTRN